MKSLRAGTTQRFSGCRRLLQAEGMWRRLVEEPEEVSLKLFVNSSARWPRWVSSSSSVETCWEATWGRHTCPQHTGSERKSHDCRRGSREREFSSGQVHLVDYIWCLEPV